MHLKKGRNSKIMQMRETDLIREKQYFGYITKGKMILKVETREDFLRESRLYSR